MKLVLLSKLFDEPNNDLNLLMILWCAFHRGHDVSLEPFWQPGAGNPVDDWCQRHGQGVSEVLECMIGGLASSETQPLRTTVTIGSPGTECSGTWPEVRMPLPLACEVVVRPLRVLVESRRTDREFLLRIAPGKHRKQALERALRQCNLEFDNGGGVESMTQHVRSIDRDSALRTVVVSDSDDQGEGPSKPVQKLEDECSNLKPRGLSYHRLRRRAIENYLPLRVLGRWKSSHIDRVHVVDTFCNKLRPEQRHHFNMKKGFSGDRSKLFEDLDEDVVSKLHKGFGPKLMAQVLFQHEYSIEEEDLRRDGSFNEFETIIDDILARL